ncbi:MAG: hypothetical protein K0S33_2534 [Bacteroidetes bacterium]|nr:hypothetical protein [Bacteroidota bacterium]
MKNILLLIFLLSVSSLAAQQPINPKAPKIQFDQETLDYGTIEYGSSGHRELKITNIGKEPLIISAVYGSDGGFYVHSFSKEPVAPGKSTVIKFNYDTKRYGSFTRSITVISNADEPSKTIVAKGQVRIPAVKDSVVIQQKAAEPVFPPVNPNAPKIQFDPEILDYGTIEKDANGMREIKCTNTGKEPLILIDVKTSCGCLVASYPKEPLAAGKSCIIQVKYDTKRTGPFQKTITVISNTEEKTHVIKVKGVVNPPLVEEVIQRPNDNVKGKD